MKRVAGMVTGIGSAPTRVHRVGRWVALAALVAAPLLAAVPLARAQDDSSGATGPHPEGQYGGVNPISPADANKVKHKHAAAKNTLQWVGFQQPGGATEIFLQAAEPFTVEQRVEGGALVLSIDGLTKLGTNARRPLDTRFFETPIVRVATKARKAHRARRGHPAAKAGIDVTITFRDGKPFTGTLRTGAEPDGMFYAYLTLPQGTGSVTPADDDAPAGDR